jgi:hypothetical protein
MISNSPVPPDFLLIKVAPNLPLTGQTGSLYLQMKAICPVGGCTIALASSNPIAVLLPAKMIIPAGLDRGTVSYVAGPVSVNTPVVLSASQSGITVNSGTDLTIRPPWPRSADGTIQMQAIGAEVQVVQNANSNQTSNGKKLAMRYLGFDISDNLYLQCQSAYPGVGQLSSAGSPVFVNRKTSSQNFYSYTQNWLCKNGPYTGWPQSFTASPAPATSATVCITQAAPAGGIVVGLVSGNTKYITVPASVVIPAGSLCTNVPVTNKDKPSGLSSIYVLITASVSGMLMETGTTVRY